MPTINLSRREGIALREMLGKYLDKNAINQAEHVADATPHTPVYGDEYNLLLKSLRDAGVLASKTFDTDEGDPLTDNKGEPLTRSRWPETITDADDEPLEDESGDPLQGWKE